MKNIVVLGSSGSIGRQTLFVINNHSDRFRIIGMSVNTDINSLSEDIVKFGVPYVAVADDEARSKFEKSAKEKFPNTKLVSVEELSSLQDADIVLSAVSGIAGLKPSLAALKAGKTLALANKEAMVTGGRYLNEFKRKYGGEIIPVDSEHSAIWQCLKTGKINNVKNIILTASGGSFRDLTAEQLAKVTSEAALNHPVWKMGKKVTVDSATLMNKGFEVIEAMYLFDTLVDNIKVVLHRQSIIHSMVEFCDGTVAAMMSSPDMRIPIQLALSWPERLETEVKPLDFYKIASLTFEEPDNVRFPCLDLAYTAVKKGEKALVALNASDEVAVDAFIKGKIAFTDIYKINAAAVDNAESGNTRNLEEIFDIDCKYKNFALGIIRGI